MKKKRPAVSTSAPLSFALALQSARKASGLTQAEVADLFSVARRAVIHWEEGDREPILPAQIGLLLILKKHAEGSITTGEKSLEKWVEEVSC